MTTNKHLARGIAIVDDKKVFVYGYPIQLKGYLNMKEPKEVTEVYHILEIGELQLFSENGEPDDLSLYNSLVKVISEPDQLIFDDDITTFKEFDNFIEKKHIQLWEGDKIQLVFHHVRYDGEDIRYDNKYTVDSNTKDLIERATIHELKKVGNTYGIDKEGE